MQVISFRGVGFTPLHILKDFPPLELIPTKEFFSPVPKTIVFSSTHYSLCFVCVIRCVFVCVPVF